MTIERTEAASPEPGTLVLPSRPDEVGPGVTGTLAGNVALGAHSAWRLSEADRSRSFVELGLDSLMLTQVSLQLQRKFNAKVSFRQLMGECSSLERLVALLTESDRPFPPRRCKRLRRRRAPNPKPAPTPIRPASRLVKPTIRRGPIGP